MLTTSRTRPRAAPVSNVIRGVLRFMSGPAQLEPGGLFRPGRRTTTQGDHNLGWCWAPGPFGFKNFLSERTGPRAVTKVTTATRIHADRGDFARRTHILS